MESCSLKNKIMKISSLILLPLFLLMIGGPVFADHSNWQPAESDAYQEAEEVLKRELGAFEITANQRELAKNNEAGYSVLDAGRGNPNWIIF